MTDTIELSGDTVQLKDYQNLNKWNLFLFPSPISFQNREDSKQTKKSS